MFVVEKNNKRWNLSFGLNLGISFNIGALIITCMQYTYIKEVDIAKKMPQPRILY